MKSIFGIGKSLNSSCTIPSECWSDECRDSVCKCRSGFIPKDGNRCRMFINFVWLNIWLIKDFYRTKIS